MKKLILAIVGVLMIVSLSACSQGKKEKKTTIPQIVYVGTIQSVEGNEIELALAKVPEELKQKAAGEGENNNGNSGDQGDSGGGESYVGGIDDLPDGKDNLETAPDEVEGNQQTLAATLEYTGENKTFTIPAGVKLVDITGGSVNVSDLNKMNVLMIIINEKDNTIVSCEILE